MSAAIAATLLFSGCGDSSEVIMPGTPDQVTGPVGSIRGRVVLQGEGPKPASDQIPQDQGTCGSSVSLPRIALGKDQGVQSTFVILEGVPSTGTPPAPTTQSVLVDQKACQYVPHALVVPVNSKIEITNSDPILHNVHGSQNGGSVFNYAQARQGQRETLDMKMTKPGIITLTCEAGHPWMNAYIYVATHPYVVLTDNNGEFVIKNVPPGTYTLKMWHEGVTLKQINRRLQLYEYEEPYELTQQVTVTENSETAANFEMKLR